MEWSVFRGLLLFTTTVLAVWAFGLILWPFIVPIAWALCLGAITARPYRYLARVWGRPRLASVVMVLVTALVILAPLILVGALVLDEAQSVDLQSTANELRGLTAVKWTNEKLESIGLEPLDVYLSRMQEYLQALAPRALTGPVAKEAFTVLAAPFVFLFGLVITLVTLYFVFCETPRMRRLVHELSPLEAPDTDRILESLHGTTSAAVLGGILVAIIQGALGGIAFLIAGIGSPALWSVVMMGFSLLPFGGTALVWAPAGIYLLLTGATFGGWFVLIWGVVIVSMSDNFLRPWILTKTGAAGIHPMLLFFAILSGIGLFGVSGIVFGPLLLALLTTVIQIYRDHGSPAQVDDAEAETAV